MIAADAYIQINIPRRGKLTARGPALIVHGGAGNWQVSLHKRALAGVLKASNAGFDVLLEKGSALDAIVAAVSVMEDNKIFNAGTGSTLNLQGDVEADAGIMDGKTLRGGGVALLRGIRNPIRAARVIMERTDHVLMAGRPAERIAVANGLRRANLKVPRSKNMEESVESVEQEAYRDGVKGDASNIHRRIIRHRWRARSGQ